MAPFPPFFRVLSTPRDRPTNIRASEPSSRLSVRGLIRFFFSFFFFNQHRVRLDRRRIVSFAPSLALRLGTLARSRSGTWPHHTHTHSLSLSLSRTHRHTPSNSQVERPSTLQQRLQARAFLDPTSYLVPPESSMSRGRPPPLRYLQEKGYSALIEIAFPTYGAYVQWPRCALSQAPKVLHQHAWAIRAASRHEYHADSGQNPLLGGL